MLVLSAFVTEYGPVLIILEDLHLFDLMSIELVADVGRALPSNCLLVTSQRPNAGSFKPISSSQVATVCHCCF